MKKRRRNFLLLLLTSLLCYIIPAISIQSDADQNADNRNGDLWYLENVVSITYLWPSIKVTNQ